MSKEFPYRNNHGIEMRPMFEQQIHRLGTEVDQIFSGYSNRPEEEQLLSISVSMVREQLDSLGLTNVPLPTSSNVHFLSKRGFLKLGRIRGGILAGASGVNFPSHGELATLRQDYFLDQINSLMHEIIHFGSFKSISFNTHSSTFDYRSGYSLPFGNGFNGFNEGVVQSFSSEIITTNYQRLPQLIGTRLETTAGLLKLTHYPDEQKVARAVVGKIAERKNEPKEKVWERIKKGLFTGHMMHLRDIDRAFGKGSLKLLSLYGSSPSGDSEKDRKIDELIFRYFTSADDSERPDLYNQIWDTF